MLELVLTRECADGMCPDTSCGKDKKCSVFQSSEECRASCGALCRKHNITVKSEVGSTEFEFHCHLLDAGKIVAISFSVGVFVAFVVFDLLLIWYCYKRKDSEAVLEDTEIGGVRKVDAVRRIQRVRNEIEEVIDYDLNEHLARMARAEELEAIRQEYRMAKLPCVRYN